jgi:hypothetical protein
MSFKLFLYYCAVCGGWAALVGWAVGRGLTDGGGTASDMVQGLFLGLAVALALGVLDAVWNTGHRPALVLGRGAFVALVGGLSGMLGTALGSGLFDLTRREPFRLAGWTLTGLLVGVSVGLYDFLARWWARDRSGGGWRKLRHGAVGGALGGILGGVLFVVLRQVVGVALRQPPENLRSSSAIGFVVLGACIGLFIGLAQVILKEAWIKVEAGRRAGREMILTREETTIGRAESCDLGLFGDGAVEKLHARIVLKNHQYLLADANTPGGTYLNDRRIDQPTPLRSGDAIRIGGHVLRFGERQKKTVDTSP